MTPGHWGSRAARADPLPAPDAPLVAPMDQILPRSVSHERSRSPARIERGPALAVTAPRNGGIPKLAAPTQISLPWQAFQIVDGRQQTLCVFPAGTTVADVGLEAGVASRGVHPQPASVGVQIEYLERTFTPGVRVVRAEPPDQRVIRHICLPGKGL